jgi:hypothetical protein
VTVCGKALLGLSPYVAVLSSTALAGSYGATDPDAVTALCRATLLPAGASVGVAVGVGEPVVGSVVGELGLGQVEQEFQVLDQPELPEPSVGLNLLTVVGYGQL